MSTPLKAPQRAHTLIVKAGGDTVRDLADELRSLANRLERGELTRGCAGGDNRGSIYEYRNDPEMTQDAYFRSTNEWLEKRKEPTL